MLIAVGGTGPESSRLIARVPHRAVDIRVHARVVEWAGENCHHDRACAAAPHGSVEITALPGGDTADDQPDGKNHRSDVHLGLHSIVRNKYECEAVAIAGHSMAWYPGRKHTRVN